MRHEEGAGDEIDRARGALTWVDGPDRWLSKGELAAHLMLIVVQPSGYGTPRLVSGALGSWAWCGRRSTDGYGERGVHA